MGVSVLGWPDAVEHDSLFVLALIPSLGTTSRLFKGLVEELARRLPEALIVCTDLPGHGSGPVASSVSIEGLADDVTDQLCAVRPQRSVVVGVSMGGAIALEAARRFPEQISGFVQINSALRFGSADGWQGLIDSVTDHGTEGLAASSAAGWFEARFRESDVARALIADLSELDDDAYIECCRALARYNGAHDLQTIEVPALLIGTADDHGTPSAIMREVAAQLRLGDFAELPAGGHLSVAEHADVVADLIVAWLTQAHLYPQAKETLMTNFETGTA